jgi:DNA-binding transcriptional MerR regulator
MTIQIYELADIAAILGIEKSRVKNWTIGRPFSVQASVRASFGKGSRNLFSRQDVYCFELVHRLNEVGVPVAAIQGMLEKLRPNLLDEAFWRKSGWLFLKRTNSDVSYESDFDPNDFGYLNITIKPEDELVCSYAINLKPIADDVSTRINVFSHRRDPSRRLRVKTEEKKKRSK